MSALPEEEYLPLSGLQHLLFCPRQCALIHVEQLWVENTLTALGRELHERVDSGEAGTRDGVETLRTVAVASRQLALSGKADLVESWVERLDDGTVVRRLFPVEYKRGPLQAWLHDEVQLCAQAMALEETLGVSVPAGAIFHGASRHRRDVTFGAELRAQTEAAAREFHRLVREGLTPVVPRQAKCDSCSLVDLCLPEETEVGTRVRRYVARLYAEFAAGPGTGAGPTEKGEP